MVVGLSYVGYSSSIVVGGIAGFLGFFGGGAGVATSATNSGVSSRVPSLTKFGLDWSQRSGATELATSLNRSGNVQHANNMLKLLVERREALLYQINQNGVITNIHIPSYKINELVEVNQSIKVALDFITKHQ